MEFIIIALIAFVLAFMDNTVGMGYGTILTAILVTMGFNPLLAVPAILLSGTINGALVSLAHHAVGNVDWDFDKRAIKIVAVLASFGLLGAVLSVLLAVSIPASFIKMYIGFIVLLMGIITILRNNRHIRFSWLKITLLGVFGSFNKGLVGGGYGPLITSGQILSGVSSKKSVPITAFSESLVSIAGLVAYVILGIFLDFNLILPLTLGAVCSIPFSVYVVKKVEHRDLTKAIGIAATLFGLYTLLYVLA